MQLVRSEESPYILGGVDDHEGQVASHVKDLAVIVEQDCLFAITLAGYHILKPVAQVESTYWGRLK